MQLRPEEAVEGVLDEDWLLVPLPGAVQRRGHAQLLLRGGVELGPPGQPPGHPGHVLLGRCINTTPPMSPLSVCDLSDVQHGQVAGPGGGQEPGHTLLQLREELRDGRLVVAALQVHTQHCSALYSQFRLLLLLHPGTLAIQCVL